MLSHEGGSLDDMRTFGIMYQFMMCSCRDNALYWFDRAIQESRGVDPELYRRTRQQKLRLQMLLGKAEDTVERQKQELAEGPEQADAWVLLVVADMYAKHYEEAYDLVQQAMERFPEEWELFIHACNIARHLEKYPEAISYADRAIAMHPELVDGMYEKAWCYEKMGKHREAGRLYLEIAEIQKRDGFEVEAETELRNARKLLERAEA
jgi:tetratricopeptide (TPR) repeat protein